MRMLLPDHCCGRCWCEDVGARYSELRMLLCEDVAAQYAAADAAVVRMLLRDTLLRTLLCM